MHWPSPNTDATNSIGFTGLPGGYRYYDVTFGYSGGNVVWWSFEKHPWRKRGVIYLP